MAPVVPAKPLVASDRNRLLIKDILDFYGVASIEELHSKDDPSYWREKLWDTWKWNLREWGMYGQVFDMAKSTDGVYPVVDHWDGVRSFYLDDQGLLTHETNYNKSTGPEHKKVVFPKEENLLEDGLACLSLGPMFSQIRMVGFPPTGHGSLNIRKITWGAPLFGEQSIQPNDQVRLGVFSFFSTPTTPGTKGSLQRIMYFRDDTKAKPFKKTQNWINDTDKAVVKDVDLAAAIKVVFPFADQPSAAGFALTNHISNGLRATITDGKVFDHAALAEGGEDARFYQLAHGVLVNVLQFPEQGKKIAAKWRVIYRLSKRLMVLVVTYDGETLKQELEMQEYAFE